MRTVRMMMAGATFLVTVGCGPLALQHGAATVPKGKVAAGASMLVVHEIGQGAAKDTSRTDLGQSAAFVRWGIHDQVDAGVQVYSGGMRGDVKLAFVNSDTLAVSMNPGVHLGYYNDTYEDDVEETNTTALMTGWDLTIAVGKKLGGGGEVWAGPRFGSFKADYKSVEKDSGTTIFEVDQTVNYRGWGGAVGAKLKMGETLWITPELGCYQRETKAGGSNDRGLSWVPAIGVATGF